MSQVVQAAVTAETLAGTLLRLLLAGETASASALLAASDNADALCSLLVQSRLAGYFHMTASGLPLESLLPAAGLAELEAAAAQQLARASRCRALLATVGQQLSAAGIPFLTLKGLYLAQRFFGASDRRFMWDVDILVQPEDLDGAVRALAGAGLYPPGGTQLDPRNRVWGIHAVEVRGDAGAVDVHHAIRRLPGIEFDHTRIWANAQEFTIAGASYRTLSDLDTLLVLAVGLGADIQTGHHNLRKLWDLYMVLRGLDQDTDWETFLAQRREEGSLMLVANVMAVCLLVLDARSDCPRLVRALARQQVRLLVSTKEQALAVYDRPRQHLANRILFARLLPVSVARYGAGWFLTLPARLWHYRTPRKRR
jgi:hypothetical protein